MREMIDEIRKREVECVEKGGTGRKPCPPVTGYGTSDLGFGY